MAERSPWRGTPRILLGLSAGEILFALRDYLAGNFIGVGLCGFAVVACYLAAVWTVRTRVEWQEQLRRRYDWEGGHVGR